MDHGRPAGEAGSALSAADDRYRGRIRKVEDGVPGFVDDLDPVGQIDGSELHLFADQGAGAEQGITAGGVRVGQAIALLVERLDRVVDVEKERGTLPALSAAVE